MLVLVFSWDFLTIKNTDWCQPYLLNPGQIGVKSLCTPWKNISKVKWWYFKWHYGDMCVFIFCSVLTFCSVRWHVILNTITACMAILHTRRVHEWMAFLKSQLATSWRTNVSGWNLRLIYDVQWPFRCRSRWQAEENILVLTQQSTCNGEKYRSVFLSQIPRWRPQMFCPHLKDIRFTVMEK